MSLIDKVKSLLGIEESPPPRPTDDVGVTVEHEPTPDVTTESAVKTDEIIEEAEPDVTEEAPEDTEAESDEDEEGATEPGAEGETADAAEEPAEAEANTAPVTDVKGIGQSYADRLADVDIETIDDLLAADVDDVAEATGISPKRLARWIETANDS